MFRRKNQPPIDSQHTPHFSQIPYTVLVNVYKKIFFDSLPLRKPGNRGKIKS